MSDLLFLAWRSTSISVDILAKATSLMPGMRVKADILLPDGSECINGPYRKNVFVVPFIMGIYRSLLSVLVGVERISARLLMIQCEIELK